MKFRNSMLAVAIALAGVGAYASSGSSFGPEEVVVYNDAPSTYEDLGLIEAAADVPSGIEGPSTEVLDALRSQAFELGANGIVITDSRLLVSAVFSTDGNGNATSEPLEPAHQMVKAQAIRVD